MADYDQYMAARAAEAAAPRPPAPPMSAVMAQAYAALQGAPPFNPANLHALPLPDGGLAAAQANMMRAHAHAAARARLAAQPIAAAYTNMADMRGLDNAYAALTPAHFYHRLPYQL